MKHRWTSVLIVALGLLVSATVPATACATQTPMDCCPGEPLQHNPDQQSPATTTQSSGACCVVVPAASAVVIQPARQQALPIDQTPDPVLPTSGLLPSRRHGIARAGPDPVSADYAPDATLTYLRTARLRI
ncbi:MAG: hypothetical protein ABI645_09645 [Pseudomonadota bacterium]